MPENAFLLTESKIPFLYGNIRVTEKPYSGIFYAELDFAKHKTQ